MKNVAAMTRSVSIPIIDAASRSKAVARIALPSRVRLTRYIRANISAIDDPTTTTPMTLTGSSTPSMWKLNTGLSSDQKTG